ncbi:SgcJ/EcaC family oxidoreductase [Streptosporangium sp. NPDC048865]|uniref:YybH family protein n=1 Tax=Streptosporangium sp. NPDC048865 TaxID=3155766 RepID=UPI00341FF416
MSHPMPVILEKWKAAFDGHRPDAMAELFTDDALFLGFLPEPASGREAVHAYYAAVPPGRTAEVRILHTYTLGETVAGGFAAVSFRADGEDEIPVNLSLVLVRDGDAWRIRQYHVSRVTAH